MPSVQDVFNEIQQANQNLQQIHTDLGDLNNTTDAVRNSVDQVAACCGETNQRLTRVIDTLNTGFTNISQGIQALITLQRYANDALANNAQQNHTIICNLEKISEQTCNLLTEAHTQTGLQTSIEGSTATLQELYKSTHPDSALELERQDRLRKQIEECCPPEEPEPACTYEPCEDPPRLPNPPNVDYGPFQPVPVPG